MADNRSHGFTRRGAKRIVDATRKAEGPPAPSGPARMGPMGGVPGGPYMIIAAVISSAMIGATNKFSYVVSRVRKTTTAHDSGAWVGVTAAADNDDLVNVTAYNLTEWINEESDGTSPTILGNGIDIDSDSFPDDYEIQPAPVGTLVMCMVVPFIDSVDGLQKSELWFQYENSVDGDC